MSNFRQQYLKIISSLAVATGGFISLVLVLLQHVTVTVTLPADSIFEINSFVVFLLNIAGAVGLLLSIIFFSVQMAGPPPARRRFRERERY
jgi:hypothetical protein